MEKCNSREVVGGKNKDLRTIAIERQRKAMRGYRGSKNECNEQVIPCVICNRQSYQKNNDARMYYCLCRKSTLCGIATIKATVKAIGVLNQKKSE